MANGFVPHGRRGRTTPFLIVECALDSMNVGEKACGKAGW